MFVWLLLHVLSAIFAWLYTWRLVFVLHAVDNCQLRVVIVWVVWPARLLVGFLPWETQLPLRCWLGVQWYLHVNTFIEDFTKRIPVSVFVIQERFLLLFGDDGMHGYYNRGIVWWEFEARIDFKFLYIDTFCYAEVQEIWLSVRVIWPECGLARR